MVAGPGNAPGLRGYEPQVRSSWPAMDQRTKSEGHAALVLPQAGRDLDSQRHAGARRLLCSPGYLLVSWNGPKGLRPPEESAVGKRGASDELHARSTAATLRRLSTILKAKASL